LEHFPDMIFLKYRKEIGFMHAKLLTAITGASGSLTLDAKLANTVETLTRALTRARRKLRCLTRVSN
jgi:hypothetical protein